MATINLYEPNRELLSNIKEILDMEGHLPVTFTDIYEFISDTLATSPNLAICSLIRCQGSSCYWQEHLKLIKNSPVITLGLENQDYCECQKDTISLFAPFSSEELIACLNKCL